MATTPSNSINESTTGVVIFNPPNFTASPVTEHYALVGGASNAITSVSPSTAGFVLTSNGVSADPSFQAVSSTDQSWSYCFTSVDGTGVNPADNTTYYWQQSAANIFTVPRVPARIVVPVSGTLKSCYGFFSYGGTPSNENATLALRLNNTTDINVSTSLDFSSASPLAFSNGSLNTAVSAGDYFDIKFVTPTWTTNPTNMSLVFTVFFQ